MASRRLLEWVHRRVQNDNASQYIKHSCGFYATLPVQRLTIFAEFRWRSVALDGRIDPFQINGLQKQYLKNYPLPKDAAGNNIITDDVLMIGGDFCEARTVTRSINGEVRTVRFKGWQIDPKTGQKTETDF